MDAHLIVTPPPAMEGGPVYRGLDNLAFLHEVPGFRPIGLSEGPAVYEGVLDNLNTAIARLEHAEREVKRRRRNPFYWVDRGLRAVLGIPAYLVSLVIGVPKVRIERSWAGFPLRVLGVAADLLAVYGGGHLLGWW